MLELAFGVVIFPVLSVSVLGEWWRLNMGSAAIAA